MRPCCSIRAKIATDDPLSKDLPAFHGSSTLRQALSRTSGITGNDAPPEKLDPIRNFDRSLETPLPAPGEQPVHGSPVGDAGELVADGAVEKLRGREYGRLPGPPHDVGQGGEVFGNGDEGLNRVRWSCHRRSFHRGGSAGGSCGA